MFDLKIGFIGFGNIATAMCKGLIDKGIFGKNIFACAKRYELLKEKCEKYGINPCKSVSEVIEKADIVFIAVKPYMVKEVLMPCRDLLCKAVFVSLVAGVYCDDYTEMLGEFEHISAIPNVAISVGEGITVTENKHTLSMLSFDKVCDLLGKVGSVYILTDDKMDIGSSLCGCTPAYVAMFAEALADGGVKHGLTRDISNKMVAQVLVGTGKLLMQKINPEELKDSVCSPGGTTIRGVDALEKGAFRGNVISAISATLK